MNFSFKTINVIKGSIFLQKPYFFILFRISSNCFVFELFWNILEFDETIEIVNNFIALAFDLATHLRQLQHVNNVY